MANPRQNTNKHPNRKYLENHPGQNHPKQPKPKAPPKTKAELQAQVTEPLTPKGVRQEVKAATNSKFRPLETKIAGDLRASEKRVGEEAGWWNNYLNTVNQDRADTAAAYQQAGQETAGQIAQASALDNANTSALQGAANESAALRGAAPVTSPAERGAAAQAQRNWLGAATAGNTANAGANQYAYLTDQKRIGAGQSIASRKEQLAKSATIREDRRNTAAERGDYAATKRGEIKQQEREYLTQRQAFGLDKKKTKTEEREARTAAALGAEKAARETGKEGREESKEGREIGKERREAETNRAENRRKNRELHNENVHTHNETQKTEHETSPGAKTQAERNAAAEGRQNASAAASQLYEAATKPPKNAQEWAAFAHLVAAESEVSPAQAQRAVAELRKRVEAERKAKSTVKGLPHF
ncbi:MAG: hypothetical protein ACRDPE_15765 [Solirubrobacterales bacterium]